jgi:phosphoglycerate kinase
MVLNEFKGVESIENLEGKYVFLRTSLNVPVKDGVVQDVFRITQALPTMEYLLERGARVILCSHLGKDATESMAPVYQVLKGHISVFLSSEVVGTTTTALRDSLKNGEALLLENVRKEGGEMKNDKIFAEELAKLAEVFVNDDFAASHRAHASLHAICEFLPSYIGLNCAAEYNQLSKTLNPEHPALFLLGGAKFETKMPLVEKFLSLYDTVFIGGALANDFFKAKGYEVGTSLVSDMSLAGSPLLLSEKILLPIDVVAVQNGVSRVCAPDAVLSGEDILDAGPATLLMLDEYIKKAKTILWNGPLGDYEHGFKEQTVTCAQLIADADAYSVVGGGDTVASIESLGVSEKFGFLSTAGGAMLTFLEDGKLVALEALKNSR